MTGSNLNRKSRTDTDLFHQLAHFSLEFSLKNENKDSKLLFNPISSNNLFASPLTLSLNCLLELVFLSLDIKVFSNFGERRANEKNTRMRKRLVACPLRLARCVYFVGSLITLRRNNNYRLVAIYLINGFVLIGPGDPYRTHYLHARFGIGGQKKKRSPTLEETMLKIFNIR